MEQHDPARAALKRLIDERREDYAGLSRLIGRNAAYIQQYITRGTPRRLAENDRRVLAEYFGVEEAVLGGPGVSQDLTASRLTTVARFNVQASAGAGTFADREQAVAHYGFEAGWLKKLCSSAASELSIIQVEGDSMYPTLSHGDDIMVDRSLAGHRIHDGIYVLRREDTLLVKRIAVHPSNKRLTISSDNPAYPSWPDCDPKSVEIIGRVIWAGRRFS